MATIERELSELRQRIEQLESTVWKLARIKPETAQSARKSLDEATVIDHLKAKGILVEPPEMAFVHSRRWRELTETEKQAIRHELDNLPPGPMLSDIIIENRR